MNNNNNNNSYHLHRSFYGNAPPNNTESLPPKINSESPPIFDTASYQEFRKYQIQQQQQLQYQAQNSQFAQHNYHTTQNLPFPISSQQNSPTTLFSQEDNPHFCDQTSPNYENISAVDLGEDGGKNENQTPPNPTNNKTTWSYQEDEALISAYMKISTDSSVGTYQNKSKFWSRVKQRFDISRAANPSQINERSVSMLTGQFRRVSAGVMKWVGCLEKATKQKTSGQSNDDVMRNARNIHGGTFKFHTQWCMLKEYPKFEMILGKGQEVDSVTPMNPSDGNGKRSKTDEVEDGGAARPIGMKAAKKNKCKSRIEDDQELSTIAESLANNYAVQMKKLERDQERDSIED